MIQFNLLPDVKLEYIKARRIKRIVIVVSALVAATVLTIFIALFMVVRVFQKQHLGNLNTDIQRDSTKLQNTPELNRILTVQNQLSSLPELHSEKPVASRLSGYLSQLTPTQVSISKLNIDFSTNTMILTGATDSLGTINKYVDTIKFTDFTTADATKQGKAFSDVVLTNYGRDDKSATYQIDLTFNPAIFDSASEVTLTVPRIITTRSETQKPGALFQQTEPVTPN